jgi:hypothetical protein
MCNLKKVTIDYSCKLQHYLLRIKDKPHYHCFVFINYDRKMNYRSTKAKVERSTPVKGDQSRIVYTLLVLLMVIIINIKI